MKHIIVLIYSARIILSYDLHILPNLLALAREVVELDHELLLLLPLLIFPRDHGGCNLIGNVGGSLDGHLDCGEKLRSALRRD